MFYPSTSPFSWDMTGSTHLPNIHPQDIDCIIRSQNSLKGSLYASNLQGAENLLTLQKLRVNTIVTCAAGYKLNHPNQIIRYYKYIPFDKNQTYGASEYFDQAADFIHEALLRSNVMIHSLTGCGRTIVILIAFFIKYNLMSYKDAYSFLQKKRKFISFDKGYEKILKQYQQKYIIKIKNNQKLITQRQNLKTIKSSNKEQNSINKDNKIYSFSDKKSESKVPSESKSSRHSTKNKQFSKDFINQTTTESFKKFTRTKEHSHKRSQTSFHQSKVSQRQKLNTSVQRAQPKIFQKIVSSSHNQFIGVKRSHKNSAMSQQKQRRSSQFKLSNYHNNIQNSRKNTQKSRLNSSNISNYNHSQQRSSMNEYKASNKSYVSQKLTTQRSQSGSFKSRSSAIKTNMINPENQYSPMLRKNQHSIQNFSPSKIQYFQKINQKITDNINLIVNEFEKESKNVREKYFHKLRNLRINQQNSQGIF